MVRTEDVFSVLGSRRPPGMPPKNHVQTYVHDALAGPSPNRPWWAAPLAHVVVSVFLLFVVALAKWL